MEQNNPIGLQPPLGFMSKITWVSWTCNGRRDMDSIMLIIMEITCKRWSDIHESCLRWNPSIAHAVRVEYFPETSLKRSTSSGGRGSKTVKCSF
eukprot:940047-Pyramimonas_sp.AAC.1